jgi:hypothetical protein
MMLDANNSVTNGHKTNKTENEATELKKMNCIKVRSSSLDLCTYVCISTIKTLIRLMMIIMEFQLNYYVFQPIIKMI